MYKIAAIIVTFNRKELLLKNVSNCLEQSFKLETIYIIDNASTDGTKEYLAANGVLEHENVNYHKLENNIGGAGGFEYGLRTAYNEDYSCFWLMDDDGCPDLDTLDCLVKEFDKFDILGPLIYCDEPNTSHSGYMVDGLMTEDISKIIKTKYSSPVHPFNGTLIKRHVVDKIGFPIKELFIWGDEQEYRLRWLRNGFSEGSITSARYYHPKNKLQFNQYWIFKTPKINSNRKYLYFRNQTWIFKNYRNFKFAFISISWLIASVVIFETDKLKALLGIYHGLTNNLSDPRIK